MFSVLSNITHGEERGPSGKTVKQPMQNNLRKQDVDQSRSTSSELQRAISIEARERQHQHEAYRSPNGTDAVNYLLN